MSPLYVYAVVSDVPAGELPAGLAGEPLRVAACGDLLVAVGEQDERPRPAADTLAAHDAAVRRLAGRVEALLPVRFGEWVRDERELEDRLAPRQRELAEALEKVRGCEQMTLRVFGDPGDPETPEEAEDATAGPGTRYLAARRRELEQARSLPELEPVRTALLPLVRAERVERRSGGTLLGLLGTAYHLVSRENLPAYRQILGETRLAAGRRLVASGPWPPYAFAPGGEEA